MNKPEFRMLVGLPGSGKSYYAKDFLTKHPDFMYFSSDEYRRENGIKQTDSSFFEEFNRLVKQSLSAGKSVLYDATNLNSRRRRALLTSFGKTCCTKSCIVMATTIDSCLRNNRSFEREHIVPDGDILKYYHNFQFPQYFEGWDNIEISRPTDARMSQTYCLEAVLKNLSDYDQNTKWHKYTLGEHMTKVGDYLASKFNDKDLSLAGYIHDIGKPYVRTTDDEGQSHYYNHDNVGAYESMFIKGDFDKVRVAQIIALHMKAHDMAWRTKYMKYLGMSGYDILADVFRLNEADCNCQS